MWNLVINSHLIGLPSGSIKLPDLNTHPNSDISGIRHKQIKSLGLIKKTDDIQ